MSELIEKGHKIMTLRVSYLMKQILFYNLIWNYLK